MIEFDVICSYFENIHSRNRLRLCRDISALSKSGHFAYTGSFLSERLCMILFFSSATKSYRVILPKLFRQTSMIKTLYEKFPCVFHVRRTFSYRVIFRSMIEKLHFRTEWFFTINDRKKSNESLCTKISEVHIDIFCAISYTVIFRISDPKNQFSYRVAFLGSVILKKSFVHIDRVATRKCTQMTVAAFEKLRLF